MWKGGARFIADLETRFGEAVYGIIGEMAKKLATERDDVRFSGL
jgi:hypothetical protein